MNKRVLIFTYFFPPIASAGTLRTYSFAKYLPQFGWDPIVVSVKNDAHHIHDAEPLNNLPPSVKIVRTTYFELRHLKRKESAIRSNTQQFSRQWQRKSIEKLSRFLLPVDDLQGWFPFALANAMRLIRKEHIDAILTSSPPETAHLIGAAVHAITKLPWIADFRDEWTSDPYRQFPTPLHKQLNASLERLVVHRATAVVSATKFITDDFRNRYSRQKSEKFVTITNGFDYDPVASTHHHSSVFTIIHTGSFAKSDGPDVFFKALQFTLQNGTISRNELRVLFIGAYGIAVPTDLKDVVSTIPFLPYHKMPEYFAQADALLLVISPRRGKAANTTKIFDYIASGKPIFAIIPPEGQAAQLLRETKTGIIVAPDKITSITRELERMFQLWRNGNLTINANKQRITRYSRQNLTHSLAQVLNTIL